MPPLAPELPLFEPPALGPPALDPPPLVPALAGLPATLLAPADGPPV